MNRRKLLKLLLLTGLASAVLFVIFFNIITHNHGILIFPGDSMEQMLQMYEGGYEKIHSGTLAGFDWSLGLGANVMCYVYYYLCSPFFLLTLLFSRNFIVYSFLYFNMLKLLLLFLTSYWWASKLTERNTSRLLAAFLIAFSGWVFMYLPYNLFLDAFLLYPLLLGFCEDYLQRGKFIALTIGIGALGIINYYFLYLFIPFLSIYAVFRYCLIHQGQFEWRNFFRTALRFAGIACLGVGLSCAVLLPCALLVKSNSRFSAGVSWSDHLSLHDLYYLFTTIFTPVFDRYSASFYAPSWTHDFIGWGGGCSLYLMVITPLLLPLLLRLKNRFHRNAYLILYTVFGIFLFFRIFSYFLQKSMDTRWIYMIDFLSVMVLMEINEGIEDHEISADRLWIQALLMTMLYGFFLFWTYHRSYTVGKQFRELCLITLLLIALVWAYCLHYQGRGILKKPSALVILLVIESIAAGRIFLTYNYAVDSSYFRQPELSDAPYRYLEENDSSFYRVLYGYEKYLVPGAPAPFAITIANTPVAENFAGFSFYSTIYNTGIAGFTNRFSSTAWSMPEAAGRDPIYNLCSAKYYVTWQGNSQIPYHYQLIHSDPEGWSVYENPNYVELGFASASTINASAVSSLPYIEQDQVMQEYIITEDSNNTSYQLTSPLEQIGTMPDQSERTLQLSLPLTTGEVYIENASIPEIQVDCYSGDTLVQSFHYSQYNYVDFSVSSSQKIDRIVATGTNDTGSPVLMRVFFDEEDGSYEQKLQQLTADRFENVTVAKDDIHASITLSQDQETVFTSIPYDTGWEVYVDGNRVETEKVDLGLIGFKADNGTHSVEFRYHINGLKTGILISIGSAAMLAYEALRIYSRRHA